MPMNQRNTRSTTRRSSTTYSGFRTGGSTRTWSPSATYSPTKFTQQRTQVTTKIASFRNINSQLSGSGKVIAFSPATINRWINFVNSGNCVYKFNSAEFTRKFGRFFPTTTPTTAASPTVALKTLQRQFGQGIKAVTRGKGNNWLIAASPNVNKGPFGSYNWK